MHFLTSQIASLHPCLAQEHNTTTPPSAQTCQSRLCSTNRLVSLDYMYSNSKPVGGGGGERKGKKNCLFGILKDRSKYLERPTEQFIHLSILWVYSTDNFRKYIQYPWYIKCGVEPPHIKYFWVAWATRLKETAIFLPFKQQHYTIDQKCLIRDIDGGLRLKFHGIYMHVL